MRAWVPVGALFAGLASLPGCGSGFPDTSSFTGNPWVGTVTTTTNGTCDGISDTVIGTYNADLVASGSGMILATTPGCVLGFSVTGDTATLANGPVTCSVATDAGVGVVQVTITSYSLTSSQNGHVLIGSVGETESVGGSIDGGTIACTSTAQISATR